MPSLDVGTIGDYLREQRAHAQLSVRQLAKQAGVSNPYLSQVERGLRKPSAEVLAQLAKALRLSAEAVYVQAGLLEEAGDTRPVEAAVLADPGLSERQKRALLDIYASFRAEFRASHLAAEETTAQTTPEPVDVSRAHAAGEPAEPAPQPAPKPAPQAAAPKPAPKPAPKRARKRTAAATTTATARSARSTSTRTTPRKG